MDLLKGGEEIGEYEEDCLGLCVDVLRKGC